MTSKLLLSRTRNWKFFPIDFHLPNNSCLGSNPLFLRTLDIIALLAYNLQIVSEVSDQTSGSMVIPVSRCRYIRGYDVMFIPTVHCLQNLCLLRTASAFPSAISVLCLWKLFPTVWTPNLVFGLPKHSLCYAYIFNIQLPLISQIFILYFFLKLMRKQVRKEQMQHKIF